MHRCLFNVAQPKSSFRRYLKTCGNKKFFITELCNTAKEITLQKINIGTFESPRVFPFSLRTISIMNFKFNSPQNPLACLMIFYCSPWHCFCCLFDRRVTIFAHWLDKVRNTEPPRAQIHNCWLNTHVRLALAKPKQDPLHPKRMIC